MYFTGLQRNKLKTLVSSIPSSSQAATPFFYFTIALTKVLNIGNIFIEQISDYTFNFAQFVTLKMASQSRSTQQ